LSRPSIGPATRQAPRANLPAPIDGNSTHVGVNVVANRPHMLKQLAVSLEYDDFSGFVDFSTQCDLAGAVYL